MNIRILAGCLITVAVLLAGGCGQADNLPPVAAATIAVDHAEVPLGSPLEVTYEFKVAEGATFAEDYRVFVHFVDADEELMWTDDHTPPTPTRQWKPGQTIKYSRLLFVPVYPYVGDASIDIGLYGADGHRLPLSGVDRGQRAYRAASIKVLPQTENIYLTFKDGWHLAEVGGDPGNEWHWTKKDATLAFKNPRRDATLYLDLDGRSGLLPSPQVVTVSIGDQLIKSFTLGAAQEVYRLPITAAQFGTEEKVEIKLGVDQSFVPAVVTAGAQKDDRELGIRVFHAFVDAR